MQQAEPRCVPLSFSNEGHGHRHLMQSAQQPRPDGTAIVLVPGFPFYLHVELAEFSNLPFCPPFITSARFCNGVPRAPCCTGVYTNRPNGANLVPWQPQSCACWHTTMCAARTYLYPYHSGMGNGLRKPNFGQKGK